jgi:hypothetical protein
MGQAVIREFGDERRVDSPELRADWSEIRTSCDPYDDAAVGVADGAAIATTSGASGNVRAVDELS